MENGGKDCWNGCSQKQGKCDWCGADGWCCRKDWAGNGCDGTFGGEKGHQCVLRPQGKGTFLSEDTFVFVITPNERTFFFPETQNLNFGD